MYSPNAFKVPGTFPGTGHAVVMLAKKKKKKNSCLQRVFILTEKAKRHIKSENVGNTIRKTITD